MAAMQYWQDRLKAGRLLANHRAYVKDYDYRGEQNADWPVAIARACLFDDYFHWATAKGLEPDLQSTFYKTLAPYIYIGEEKKKQVVNIRVRESRYARGKLVSVKVSRYFIRLFPHEAHVKRFEQKTGLKINFRGVYVGSMTLTGDDSHAIVKGA